MKTVILMLATALVATGATAQTVSDDGRLGGAMFDGAALDTAMGNLNTFLQARYEIDEEMGKLHFPAPAAVLAALEGGAEPAPVVDKFGPFVSNGESLDANLAALHETIAEYNQRNVAITDRSFDTYTSTFFLY